MTIQELQREYTRLNNIIENEDPFTGEREFNERTIELLIRRDSIGKELKIKTLKELRVFLFQLSNVYHPYTEKREFNKNTIQNLVEYDKVNTELKRLA